MMKFFIWLVAMFILVVFQAGILVPLHLAPVNLILVLCVIAALLSDYKFSLGLCLGGGILLDFISTTPDGLLTLSLLGTFLIIYFIFHSLLSRDPNQIILFTSVASASIVYLVFFLIFNQAFKIFGLGVSLGFKNFVITQALPLLIFNLVFTYPVYKYYIWIQKQIHSKLRA